jgi:dUTP pyrophosphatase
MQKNLMKTMKNNELDFIRKKILDLSDPNKNYTQEDFYDDLNRIMMENNTKNDFRIKLKFVNKSDNPDPEYATEGSSGFDLRANLSQPMVIESGKFDMVPTGLYFDIPDNFEIQVRPRSGLAAKNGVTVLNAPGTVDSDYTGEVKVILINHGEEDFIINHGDRIAQAVVSTVSAKNVIKLEKIYEISKNTERASGGFGSTGKN